MSGLDNILLLTDSYKISHYKQYPPGTTSVYSYFESRGGEFPETVFFGLQYFLKRYLQGQVVTKVKINEADSYYSAHFGKPLFNRAGWEHIVTAHNGHLPVSIKAVPEGTVVPTHNVLMTIENTCTDCFWVTNYLETLLVQVWYPTTVATLSREAKAVIAEYLGKTGDPNLINFKLHDFGFRGVSSVESAGIGGAAHLVNFLGSDTVAALVVTREFYGEPMAGFSIPAAEHSTITSWGRENEAEAFRNMLNQFGDGLVAVVSDSYNIFNACEKLWGTELRSEVWNMKGNLVVRPDSGDPVETVAKVIQILGDRFGFSVNSKGYKVLNPKVRIIQGDGVNLHSIARILQRLEAGGWSADNLAFGMGGALLQKVNRDTQNFAFKASHVVVNGEGRDVFKQPIGQAMKKSKRGRLALLHTTNGFLTVAPEQIDPPNTHDALVEVFRNGFLKVDQKLSDIRQRAAIVPETQLTV